MLPLSSHWPTRWWLATREVESPHTTQFYYEQKQSTEPGYQKAAQHWYNGQMRDTRSFTAEMNEARLLVAEKVRQVLAPREKHPLEWNGPWEPNVAAANCYRGSSEGVAFHSDVLTYLGPRACIASVSLGCERVFRLRAAMELPDHRKFIAKLISFRPADERLQRFERCRSRCRTTRLLSCFPAIKNFSSTPFRQSGQADSTASRYLPLLPSRSVLQTTWPRTRAGTSASTSHSVCKC